MALEGIYPIDKKQKKGTVSVGHVSKGKYQVRGRTCSSLRGMEAETLAFAFLKASSHPEWCDG